MATITLTATPEPDSIPPRVRLDVTATGTPAVTSVTILRLDPTGRTNPVRTADDGPLALSGSALVYDYEVPYGATVTYSIAQANNPVTDTLLDVRDVWLIHPGVPGRSVRLPQVAAVDTLARPVEQGVFQVVGRPRPIVVTGGARAAASSKLRVRTFTDDERVALGGLLDDASPLLLNIPTGKAWGLSTDYIAVADTDEAREAPWGRFTRRLWDLPFQIVDRPAGGTQSGLTWADIAARYTSWADLANKVPTWADLADPPPTAPPTYPSGTSYPGAGYYPGGS